MTLDAYALAAGCDQRLLLPLSALPGLDPVGLRCASPPLFSEVEDDLVVRSRHNRYVVLNVRGELEDLPRAVLVLRPGVLNQHDAGHGLLLSDASTRDRCLRWLAGRVGLAVGCGAPAWWCVDSIDRVWTIDRPEDDGGFEFAGDPDYDATYVPTLADLDPTDDTRLSDGSRLVDALALAAVLRHVGGTQ